MDLKQRLEEYLGGMPMKKQKLRILGGTFVKDTNTLAYYNVTNEVQFEVGVKARGGRK
jgi:splicing factor 3A subunit 1